MLADIMAKPAMTLEGIVGKAEFYVSYPPDGGHLRQRPVRRYGRNGNVLSFGLCLRHDLQQLREAGAVRS